MQYAVEDREGRLAHQVREPRDRRHKGVLDRALPALPLDRLAHQVEHQRQVVPDQRPNHQVQDERVDLRLGDRHAGDRARGLADECDRERVHYRVGQPDQLPGPVALDQVGVALDKGVHSPQLAPQGAAGP